MYLGQIVEKCRTEELFERPLHPYTRALLSAILVPSPKARNKKREILKGEITSPINPAPGCRFAKRCNYATAACAEAGCELRDMGGGHMTSCARVNAGELKWD